MGARRRVPGILAGLLAVAVLLAVSGTAGAQPAATEGSYRVEYDGPNNRPTDDRVVLQLAFDGEQYLIDGER